MNTQANVTPRDAMEAQRVAAAPMATTRPMYWLIQREVWEYRSIYIAPLVAAGVFLLAFLFTTLGRCLSTPNLDERLAILQDPETYKFAGALIMGAGFVVGIAYCLGTLNSERRDRSILFWKSLPVSDRATVLSKMFVATVVIPLVSYEILITAEWIMLLVSSLVALGSGLSLAPLWGGPLFRTWGMLLYHLATVHMLWYAPFYAWLLLASAWARRGAVLWAALPPAAIGVIERMSFGTMYFFRYLQYRVEGGPEAQGMSGFPDAMMHITPARFLATPGLWGGLIVAAIFLAGAIRLRRYQAPM
jgi:ABC-2 type transport system permease protein